MGGELIVIIFIIVFFVMINKIAEAAQSQQTGQGKRRKARTLEEILAERHGAANVKKPDYSKPFAGMDNPVGRERPVAQAKPFAALEKPVAKPKPFANVGGSGALAAKPAHAKASALKGNETKPFAHSKSLREREALADSALNDAWAVPSPVAVEAKAAAFDQWGVPGADPLAAQKKELKEQLAALAKLRAKLQKQSDQLRDRIENESWGNEKETDRSWDKQAGAFARGGKRSGVSGLVRGGAVSGREMMVAREILEPRWRSL